MRVGRVRTASCGPTEGPSLRLAERSSGSASSEGDPPHAPAGARPALLELRQRVDWHALQYSALGLRRVRAGRPPVVAAVLPRDHLIAPLLDSSQNHRHRGFLATKVQPPDPRVDATVYLPARMLSIERPLRLWLQMIPSALRSGGPETSWTVGVNPAGQPWLSGGTPKAVAGASAAVAMDAIKSRRIPCILFVG